MKNKLKELDVDFIGGQEPITKEEEQSISVFIKATKEKKRHRQIAAKFADKVAGNAGMDFALFTDKAGLSC